MKKPRKVYIVMGYACDTKNTYISEVCSSRKKAEAHQKFMEEVMQKHEPYNRVYWVFDQRVV